MNSFSPSPSHGLFRVLTVSLLSFALLTTPLASAAAAVSSSALSVPAKSETKNQTKPASDESIEHRLFVNAPASAALPEPVPASLASISSVVPLLPAGAVTATMAAALTATANNGDGKADPGDTITYTVQLGNTTGTDATGLTFSDTIDSHTTLFGSVNSTPVTFDVQTSFNEGSSPVTITLSGQDPDGNLPSNAFSIVTPPTKGTLGAIGTPTCTNGVCSANVTYTLNNSDVNGSDSFTFKVNDGTSDSNQVGTVSITINAVNDPPTFSGGTTNQTVNEDAGAQSVTGFVTSISPGPSDESSQTVSFVVTNDNNGLFSTQPAIDASGKLTYTAGTNANGTANVTFHAHDTGGTANGGVDNSADAHFKITVNAVNDAPVAQDKSFSVQANMKIITVNPGLLTGVTDPDKTNGDLAYTSFDDGYSPTFTVNSITIGGSSPCTGATISSINTSTGTFDFDPAPGFAGTCTLQYTVKDTGNPAPGVTSAAATITVTVNGPIIWFVNPATGPATGAGTLSSPFSTLAQANTKLSSLAANQRVFVYTGTTAVGDTITLQGSTTGTLAQAQAAAHWLIGQGAIATNFDTLFGINPPTGTMARPAINGTRPTIKGTVTMKENTVVEGLNIDVSAGATKGLTASSLVGTGSGSVLTIADVNVTSGGGNAVDFNSAQTINYTTSNASTSPNIITSGTGIALNVFSTTIGSGGLTFQSITAGTAAGGPSKGIVLNNTGTTAGLTVTGTGTTAGSGGTIQKTNSNGIDLRTVKFISLKNMNLTNTAQTNGDVSTNCGMSSSSGANVNCNAALYLSSANTVTLDNVTIDGSNQNGINGLNVVDLKILNSTVKNAGNESGETGVYIQNLSGNNLALTNSTFSNNFTTQFGFVNFTNGIAAGSSSNPFNVSGCTFTGKGNKTTPGGDGFQGAIHGTGTGYVSIGGGTNTASTFKSNYSYGAQLDVFDTANATFIVHGCNFGTLGTNTTYNNSGITTGVSGGATMNYTITNNTIIGTGFGDSGAGGEGAIVLTTGTLSNGATYNGSINSNTIGSTSESGSGCEGNCNGIYILMNGGGSGNDTFTGTISGNAIHQVGGNAIQYLGGSANQVTGSIHINGNTIDSPFFPSACSGTAACGQAINLTSRTSGLSSTPASSLCADIGTGTGGSANTISGAWNVFDINLSALSVSTFKIGGWNGSPANDPTAFVASKNGIAQSLVRATRGSTNQGSFTGDGTTCSPLMLAPGGVNAISFNSTTGHFDFGIFSTTNALAPVAGISRCTAAANGLSTFSTDATTLHGIADIAAPTTSTASLTQQQLDAIVSAAIERWKATGLTEEQIATLHTIKFEIADLGGSYLGETEANRILVDRKAGGKGWFVDPNPMADASFAHAASSTRLYTDPWSAPAGHLDLLTAVMHEMGHQLKLDDTYSASDRNNLMYGYLTAGERRLPTQGQARFAQLSELDSPHFLSLSPKSSQRAKQFEIFAGAVPLLPLLVPVGGTITIQGTGSGFTLPTGKTITITFKVTLNNPPNLTGVPPAAPQVSTQGTLNGSPSISLVTDDPNTVTANDATVTPVDLFDTTNTLSSTATPWSIGQSITLTATVASSQSGTTITGTVVFKDGANTVSGCGSVSVSGGQAQCTISSLSSGAHSFQATYSGDGNFDPSTSNTISQTPGKSDTTTAVQSSQNPSFFGQNVTFTATVTSNTSVTGPPTGTVTFKDNGNAITCTNGGTGTQTLSSGSATCQTSSLTGGSTHTITAEYSGDTNFNISTGTLSGGQTVNNKTATTTTVTSSLNPSSVGQVVTYTATVSGSGGTPTGTATFKDNGSALACSNNGGNNVVALGGGTATCQFTYTSTTGSPHTITADYSGDTQFDISSGTLNPNQTVNACIGSPIVTSTADDGTAGTLRSAINAVCPGGTITFSNSTAGGATNFFDGNPHTINLVDANGELAIGKGMTITGPGASVLTVQRDGAAVNNFRVFNVTTGTVNISGMTISNGNMVGTAGGAGALGGTVFGGGISNAGTLTLTNTIVSGNHATGGAGGGQTGSAGGAGGDAYGGAIFNSSTLNLVNSTVNGANSATGGKGGDSDTTNGNGGNAFGGGVYNTGTLNLTNSTIDSNTATGGAAGGGAGGAGSTGNGLGGGIYNDATASPDSVTITGSTISNNTASLNGGGIYNVGTLTNAALTLTNSTVSGNKANVDGGGIYNDGATGTTTLTSVTVTNNRADNDNNASGVGGGINVASGTFTLKNTIVAGNFKGTGSTADDISGSVNAASTFNLIGDVATSGGLQDKSADAAHSNIVGNSGVGTINITTVLNTTLADNGGPTKTHALVDNSQAIDNGKAFGLGTDQRGFLRPVDQPDGTYPNAAGGDASDIGAVEREAGAKTPDAPVLDASSGGPGNTTNDSSPTFNISNVDLGATVQLLRDGNPVATGFATGNTIQLTDPGPLSYNTTYLYSSKQTLGSDTKQSVGTTSITLNTTPNAPDLDAASDSGANNSDNITNVTTNLSFTITGLVSGSTVELLRDGNPVASGTASGTSIQLVDPGPVSSGDHLYTAHQKLAGDSTFGASSSALTVTIAITPDAPDLDAASDSAGASNSDNITKINSNLSFTITNVVNGATVELLRDGNPIGGGVTGVASGTSIQLVDPGPVADGLRSYTARQTVNSVTSPQSNALGVTIDTTPPTPSVPDLKDASDTGASQTDNRTGVTPRDFTIASTETGSQVVLLRNGNPVTGVGASATGTGLAITLTDADTLPDGTYLYSTRETDLAGNVGTSGTLSVTIDTTAPSVVSITRADANPTNAATVHFNVTFSEAVTGVDSSDFAVTTTGGITGASVTGVSGSGASYVVTVNTGNGDGSLRLDFVNDNSVKDAMNLSPTANFTSGEVYTVSKSDPFVSSITRADANPTNAASVHYTVTFSKPVTGVDTSDFALTTSGISGASVTNVTPVDSSHYTVTVGTGTGDGTLRLDLIDDDTIADTGGRKLGGTGTGNGNFTGEVYTVDKTAPTVSVAKAAGQADPVTGPTASTVINFTVTFSEPVTNFDSSDVNITGSAGATVANVSQIAPNDGTTYNVGVEGMTQSGSVTITIPANAAQDLAGNGNTSTGPSNTATVQFFKDNFTSFVVNSTADTDDGQCAPVGIGNGCTLREAINAANADAGAETISFDSTVFAPAGGPYTITLLTALPALASDMTISGAGANLLTVKRSSGAATRFRVFTINSGSTVQISGLTISGGFTLNGAPGISGGGIQNSGTLTLTGVAVSGNQTGQGAGCANCTAGDGGAGGGISNGGTLNLVNSTVSGNQTGVGGTGFSTNGVGGSGGPGGGISNTGTLIITNSTISGNQTGAGGTGNLGNGDGGSGGGISNSGTLTINNSTVTGNTTGSGGGGNPGGSGGGINRSGGTVTLSSTIVAGNSVGSGGLGPDLNGTVHSNGYNLIKSTVNATIVDDSNAGTNITGQDAQLKPLADNGGQTQTHALQCTSPAIDRGKAFGQTTDQRGFTRPLDFSDSVYPNAAGGDGSDIGAFESQSGGGCIPIAIAPNPQPSTNEDTPVTVTMKGTFTQNTPLSFTITQQPSNGSLSNQSAPNCSFDAGTSTQTCTATIQYSPAANFNGADLFKFKVSAPVGGGTLDSDEADVNITINAVNDPPVTGGNLNLTVDEDNQLPITLTGTDIDSATLTFSTTSPSHGTLSALNTTCSSFGNCSATLTYTPAANYNGTDSFTYMVNDGTANSAPATVSIIVHSIADTPSVTNATTAINKQTTSGLVITRSNVDGPEIGSFKISNIKNGTLFKSNGTTQINSGDFITAGEGAAGLKFTPDHNLSSPGTTFSFDVQGANNAAGDGIGPAATATITVNCGAATVVTNTNDSGAGSLRDVITNACPGNTITFNIPTSDPGFNSTTGVTTITLTSGELLIDRDLTIQGPGANKLTVRRDSAAPNFRIFNVTSGTVGINGLTISNGNVTGDGGGILNQGTLTLSASALVGNTSSQSGGAIANQSGGKLTVTACTISGNTQGANGVITNSGILNIANSTIADNSGQGIVTALANFNTATIINSTIAGNTIGIIQSSSSTTSVGNTIVAGNGADISAGGGTFNSLGNNLIGHSDAGSGFTNGVNGDKVGTNSSQIDPLLLPLADNGGPVKTRLLLPGSPAVNAGSNTIATNAGLTTDERGTGFPRVVNTTVDIGAVEVSYTNAATAGNNQSATINSAFATQLKATIKESGNLKANIPVTFTAPSSGASGAFQGTGATITVNTDANGVATAPVFTANGVAGSYNVVASLATGQPTSTFALTNNTAATSTVVVSSVNPSDFNQSVTFTASVSSAAGHPTGTVQFKDNGVNLGSPVALSVVGLATFTTSSLAIGTHPITADYSGDGNFLPSSGTLAGGQVVKSQLSIADVSLAEGDSGTKSFNFTVTLSQASTVTAKVDFATSDGTANAGSDYVATSGTLTFNPGETQKTITVLVNGDTLNEPDETFFVTLSNPVNATITRAQATGTIQNDDGVPSLSINDVTKQEGNSGTTDFTFTVTLSAASGQVVTVNFATADGTATVADNDYQAASGTLTFSPGQTTQTITVKVNGDTKAEADENFFVNLSNSVNAAISDNQGVGTILSDDTPLVQFSAAAYNVKEDGLHATITVKRLGDLSKPATVDYATSDPSGLNDCSKITGNASQRCDYAISVGTLRFAAGEDSKTIFVPIVNDVYVEGPEFFTISLSNPVGAELGAITSARVNIIDDDNAGQQNPVVDDAFFVRQLYIDFLDREPDPAGLQGWLDILHNTSGQCKIPTDCDRIAVALGFVRSPEFQDRGYFIFRFYSTALGRNPGYFEFMSDMARVSGFLNSSELEANKSAFVDQFMSRDEFKNLYDVTLNDPAGYVDKLLKTVGLPNHPSRNGWVAGLQNGTLTRAQVLRQIVESVEVYTKFYNQALIVMQYFGFLRRDPDAAYLQWIDIFNHSSDYRILVNGFINSPEYPLRFGP